MLKVIVLACGAGGGISPEVLRHLELIQQSSPGVSVCVDEVIAIRSRPVPDLSAFREQMSRYIHAMRYKPKPVRQKARAPAPRDLGRDKIRGQQGRVVRVRANGGRYSR